MTRTKRQNSQGAAALPVVPRDAAAAGIHGHPPHRVLEGEVPAASQLSPPPAIGPRLKQFRLRENLTLQDLQAMTGISKSMLSQIERGVVNPTFARVWHLTQSLGIGVGDLLGDISSSLDRVQTYEHLKVNKTPVMTSADGLCMTRILSPIHQSLPFEWYEMIFKPGGSLRANAHGNGSWEHQTVMRGSVIVEFGDQDIVLREGETVRYSAEQPHGARNETDKEARVLLVVISRKELSSFGY
jgi:XRE family transcriptional regulator, regulator of sulfur utilization